MGLLDLGIPARDYSNNRKHITCKLYEGNLIYNRNGIGKDGRTTEQHSLSAPMELGQYVELHEDSTARHIIVQPAAQGSTTIIGRLVYDPRLNWTPDSTYQTKNRLPKENCNWGDYSPRSGAIEFFGSAVDYVDVVEENDAIAIYDNIEYDDEGKFKKSTGTTNLTALGAVEALAEGKVVVLADWVPYGAVQE